MDDAQRQRSLKAALKAFVARAGSQHVAAEALVRAGAERWAHAPDGAEAPEGAWEREIAAIVRRTGRPHRDLLGAEAWPVEVEGAAGVVICGR